MSHRRHSFSITSWLLPPTDLSASISILVARVFYAVNWFNVAAIFPLVILDFGKHDIGLLGSISAAFFIGVGLFQVPAGILAARYSARTAAIFGIALSSGAALLCGFITDESQLVLLRFIVGAGMAFFFSSGIVLIAKHAVGISNSGDSSSGTRDKKKEKSSGFAIGLMNAAHSGGGILGLFGWIVIAEMFGWRTSLVLGGAIGIATAVLMIIFVPLLSSPSSSSRPSHSEPPRTAEGKTGPTAPEDDDDVTARSKEDNDNEDDNYSEGQQKDLDVSNYPPSSAAEPQSGHVAAVDDGGSNGRWPPVSEVWAVLSNTRLVALGLVLTGVQTSWALLLTFAVVYLKSLSVQLESTGIIASMALVSAIVSAPLIGGFYDRMKVKDSRKILLLCGVGISISLAAMSIQILPVIITAVIAIGFFSGGAFTVVYAKASAIRVPARSIIGSNDNSNSDNNCDDGGGEEPADLPYPSSSSPSSSTDDDDNDNNNAFYNSSALNVAWVNGLSLLGVLWMPLAFSLAVRYDGGYPNAWLLSAVLAALFVFIPLKKVGK